MYKNSKVTSFPQKSYNSKSIESVLYACLYSFECIFMLNQNMAMEIKISIFLKTFLTIFDLSSALENERVNNGYAMSRFFFKNGTSWVQFSRAARSVRRGFSPWNH